MEKEFRFDWWPQGPAPFFDPASGREAELSADCAFPRNRGEMLMLVELAVELTLFALLVASGYYGVATYVRLRQPRFHSYFLRRRLAIIGFLMLLVAGTKIFEDVLAGESGVIDRQALVFLHGQVPAGVTGFFAAVTVAGSAVVVVPVAVLAALALALQKRRSESVLVLASLAAASTLVFTIKVAAGRVRPNLWETQWYWGSSFPSGHTLHTAAVSTAFAICAGRLWPRCASWAMWAAMGWTSLVAILRLVLGVHWPTDVLAAMCLGAFIPLAISMAMELRAESSTPGKGP